MLLWIIRNIYVMIGCNNPNISMCLFPGKLLLKNHMGSKCSKKIPNGAKKK